MAHQHNHGPANFQRAFAIGVALNLAFVATEVVFGVLAHSIALISDAGHNLSDALGLLLAWGASTLARRHPSTRRTYGLRRSSILAALLNAVVLLIVTGGVVWESVRRFGKPDYVAGKTVILVAIAGVAVNGITALLFLSGRKGDLNIRGAFIHMAADAVLSLGVALAGAVILATGWLWLDPTASLVISGFILFGTWGLLRESVNLALDAVPEGIDVAEIGAYLAGLPGVANVHDLHVWGMSTTETALTAHLVIPSHASDAFLAEARQGLHDRFGIEHATIQVETGDPAHPCALESPESV
jgi:cobalt-zinc-cadmium efflux system protein